MKVEIDERDRDALIAGEKALKIYRQVVAEECGYSASFDFGAHEERIRRMINETEPIIARAEETDHAE